MSSKTKTLLAIMFLFYVVYVGLEATSGVFLAPFSVVSKANLTKVQGAHITAAYYGSFAGMR